MAKDRLIRIIHGSYGRATLHLIEGALVAHAHAEFHLIFKLGGSDALFKVDDSTVTVSDDRALLINPWSTHAKLDQGPEQSLLLALLLDPGWLGTTLDIENAATGLQFKELAAGVDGEIATALAALSGCLAHGETHATPSCEEAVAQLVRATATRYARLRSMTEVLATSKPLDYRIKRAAEFIRNHAWDNPNVETVANAVGMSRSRLFDQFKACMGISPQQYLDWVRVSLATRLLTERHTSIGEVSHQLGFSAQSHFTRFFVQHLGISPSEFRRTGVVAGVQSEQ
jgi:AraC-like DNA-binding protein